MLELENAFEFPVVVIGCRAAQFRRAPLNGKVIAVFDSTFYITAGEHMLCIGAKDMLLGPLNVVTAAPPHTNWPASGVRLHAEVLLSAEYIRVGKRFAFALARSSIWSPSPIGSTVEPQRARLGLDAFRELAVPCVPKDGLGRWLLCRYTPDANDRVGRAAQPSIEAARSWLSATLSKCDRQWLPAPIWVERLAGLGPGLTPSGDDFLGGLLIALHAVGQRDASQVLWQQIRNQVQATGNAISLAHLLAAADGTGSAAMHDVLAAILHADIETIQAGINRIDSIGHTSGWDTMAGIVTALECWHAASRPLSACEANSEPC